MPRYTVYRYTFHIIFVIYPFLFQCRDYCRGAWWTPREAVNTKSCMQQRGQRRGGGYKIIIYNTKKKYFCQSHSFCNIFKILNQNPRNELSKIVGNEQLKFLNSINNQLIYIYYISWLGRGVALSTTKFN